MTKAQLIQRLSEFPDDMEVMTLDGIPGSGMPREINHGPRIMTIGSLEANECVDCEDRESCLLFSRA
jgi:hypothetical protein